MPRHEAPNHSDCAIDCPGGGFAHYTEQYGPCTTGCDPDGLAEAHAAMVRSGGWQARSSGVVRGIMSHGLKRMVEALAPMAQRDGRALNALRELDEAAHSIGKAERISMEWQDSDAVDVIEKLTITSASPMLER